LSAIFFTLDGGVAQVVEHATHIRSVRGSNPCTATNFSTPSAVAGYASLFFFSAFYRRLEGDAKAIPDMVAFGGLQ
jgi:hypothetical protein